MKKLRNIALAVCLFSFGQIFAKENKDVALFKENKGQIVDQNNSLRNDILYYGNSDGLTYFFKKAGISYQLYLNGKNNEIQVSRIDMIWLGANPDAKVISNNKAVTVDNFYNTPNKDGITGIRNFGDLLYDDIYKDIDLHYYYKNNSLKYDFIVAPNADYKLIQIKIDGATSIRKNGDGTLSINTPNGILKEGAPVAFQNGKEIKSSWILKDNTLSFSIDNYDSSLPLTIDPLVYQWQVTFGSSGLSFYCDIFKQAVSDGSGNIYAIDNHVLFGDGVARIYKYDAAGNEIWNVNSSGGSTYSLFGFAGGISMANNNIYICGNTNSSTNVATTGAYQTTLANAANGTRTDCFIAKYDTSGAKLWGTYYGGSEVDEATKCKVDGLGNVYICGDTKSTNNMSSVGAYKVTNSGLTDAFIAKFTSNGQRIWSSYFGGTDVDVALGIDVSNDKLVVSGYTKSTTGIAISTTLQPSFSGNLNGFLLCMDTSGNPQWSTYYGLDSTIAANCIINNGYIYLCGRTKATSSIATSGIFQSSLGGGFDGFLAKFDLAGNRQWGTYYGGTGDETAMGVTIGSNSNLYLCGNTNSSAGISTPWSYNADYAPVNSSGVAYLAELDTTGQRISGTYYNNATSGEECSAGPNGVILLSGYFYIENVTDYKSILAKFSYCNEPSPSISATVTNVCVGMSTQISTPAVSGATYRWYRNDTLITGITNNTYSTSIAGNYRVQLNNCPSGVSSPITINVYPALNTAISKTDAPCTTAAIGSITVTASGGTSPYSYTWDNSANTTNTLSGLIPGSYVVHTSDVNSCTKHDTVVIANTMNIPSTQIVVANVPCYGSPIGSIEVTASGGTPPYSYTWDNSANTTNILSGLTTGDYVVHTIDANTCEKIDSVTVGQNTTTAPSDPLASICAVTVDSATGKNLVIWEKNGTVNAIAYNVYRESIIAGQYDLIGTNTVDEFSTFLDAGSIPLQQSYSYKIAEVDSCNHEWPLSDFHKTIHLSSNVGINGEVNLSWNQYEGKPYNTHNIMRSFNGGPFTLLNQVSSSITSYSDLTPPAGVSVYRIEIDLGTECNPSKPTDLQLIKSNTISHGETGIGNIPDKGNLRIIPNPTKGEINIIGGTPSRIELYDVFGRLLLKEAQMNKLDISNYSKGIYMICLFNKSNELFQVQKIILE